MKQILLTNQEKNQILEELGVARSTMLAALNGKRTTALAKVIRKMALELVKQRET